MHKVLGVVVFVAADAYRCLPGIACTISQAASRSIVPVAEVRRVSRIRLCLFSISTWPMKQSLVSGPEPLCHSLASWSVLEACVSFRRRSPWESTAWLRPPPPGEKLHVKSLADQGHTEEHRRVGYGQYHTRLPRFLAALLGGSSSFYRRQNLSWTFLTSSLAFMET